MKLLANGALAHRYRDSHHVTCAGLTGGMRYTGSVLLLSAILCSAAPLSMAQAPSTAPDNTKVNTRDRKTSAVTADQQKENRSDRDITADIRKALMDNKDMSTYAHNVKVITRNGMVTLKGPVRSEDEKKAIEAKATEIAGNGKVKSMLAVKPKS